jgi:hypothetical protein
MITIISVPYGTDLVENFNTIDEMSREEILKLFPPVIEAKSHKAALSALCSLINTDQIDTENDKIILLDTLGCVNF